jgi:hypothetical protein
MTEEEIQEVLTYLLYISTNEVPFNNNEGIEIQSLVGENTRSVVFNKIQFKIIKNLSTILPLMKFKNIEIQQKSLGNYMLKIFLLNQYGINYNFDFLISKNLK